MPKVLSALLLLLLTELATGAVTNPYSVKLRDMDYRLDASLSAEELVAELLELVGRSGEFEIFVVEDSDATPNRHRRVQFRPIINGIEVDADSYFIIDSVGVIRTGTLHFPVEALPVIVDEASAYSLAEQAVKEERGIEELIYEESSTEIRFELGNMGASLIPYWSVRLKIIEPIDESEFSDSELTMLNSGDPEKLSSELLQKIIVREQGLSGWYTVRINAYTKETTVRWGGTVIFN